MHVRKRARSRMLDHKLSPSSAARLRCFDGVRARVIVVPTRTRVAARTEANKFRSRAAPRVCVCVRYAIAEA